MFSIIVEDISGDRLDAMPVFQKSSLYLCVSPPLALLVLVN
jgi:hypothetical protein